MPVTNIERPYNALNGEELRKVVIDKALEAARKVLDEELAGIPDLAMPFTFPVIRNLVFTLKFEVYPTYGDGKREFGVAVTGPPAPHHKPVPISVKGGIENIGETLAPDQIRLDHGLGIPSPTSQDTGVVVDSWVKPREP